MTSRSKAFLYFILAIALLTVLGKCIWVYLAEKDTGSFDTERNDILQRRDYLLSKIDVKPEELLREMPSAVGPQFQGEWALYSCSMLSASLVNIARIYPDQKDSSMAEVGRLIDIALSPEIRAYDTTRWGEDALSSLSGNLSHISYLSHISWMIEGFKALGGDTRFDSLNDRICEAMNRRILKSPVLNLQTYPGEYIYTPDMLVAIVALALHARQNGGRYQSTVNRWLDYMKENQTEAGTGIIKSFIPDGEVWIGEQPVVGSYSALSCYYLTFVDEDFAREQYGLFKEHFLRKRLFTGFSEAARGRKSRGSIDSGPVILGLSPTGTAFGIGSVTYFGDSELRKKLLRTAEWAGFTVSFGEGRHYALADLALVGEAITLAMRTAVPWEPSESFSIVNK